MCFADLSIEMTLCDDTLIVRSSQVVVVCECGTVRFSCSSLVLCGGEHRNEIEGKARSSFFFSISWVELRVDTE